MSEVFNSGAKDIFLNFRSKDFELFFFKGQLDQEEKKEKSKRSGKKRVLAQLALKKEEEEALLANRVLTALLETEEDIAPVIGVEEVSQSVTYSILLVFNLSNL